jgi:hypothetical protein
MSCRSELSNAVSLVAVRSALLLLAISCLLVGTVVDVVVLRLPLCSECGFVSLTAVCGACVGTVGYAGWREYEFALRAGDADAAAAVVRGLRAHSSP